MSKVDVSQAICLAIDIIVNKKLANANFNRTVLARIVEELDSEGKYLIQYQDNRSTAYALNKNITYAKDEAILLLIPSNDWNGDKIIISSAKELNNMIEEKGEYYNLIGENIAFNNGAIDTISLSSYLLDNDTDKKQVIIFDVNSEDNQKLRRYVKQSADGLVLSAYIRTDFDNDRFDNLGIYGIDYNIQFLNSVTNLIYNKIFTLDTRDVIGQPYVLNNTQLVKHIESDIVASEFVGIESITVYIKGFTPIQSKIWKKDVYISNISVCAANILSLLQSQGINLWFTYPNGTQINNNIATVILRANLKKDGKNILSNVLYRWYRENAAAALGSTLTDPWGGSGWLCLSLLSGIPSYFTETDFSFTKNSTTSERTAQVRAKYTKIKCIATYQKKRYEAYATVEYTSGINITIDSQDKVGDTNQQTYYNYQYNSIVPNPIRLTCLINGISDSSNYQFYWRILGAGLDEEAYNQTINFIKLENFSLILFICTVLSSSGAYEGSANFIIYNKRGLDNRYSVQILNGARIFQYYDDGELAGTDEGLTFTPLLIVFYDPDGKAINLNISQIGEEYDIKEILWSVPRNNSIIQVNTQSYLTPTSALIPDPAGSENDFYHFKNQLSLSYSIALIYNATAINNTIDVYLYYLGDNGLARIIKGSTTFLVVKAGDPGTNGTDTIATIVPEVNGIEYTSRRIYVHATNNMQISKIFIDNINQDSDNNNFYFKFKLLQNNIPIMTLPNNITWMLPIDTLGQQSSFISSFACQTTTGSEFNTINKNASYNLPTSVSNIVNLNNGYVANILRAKYITSGNLIYYTEFPLGYVYTQSADKRLKIKNNSGYTFVSYSESGMNPKYDNDNEFIVLAYIKNNDSWDLYLTNLTYSWRVVGNLMNPTAEGNRAIIEPNISFNGIDLNSGIICEVKQGNSLFGIIYIPIYMYINRFNHKYLNDWDGNSIQIDELGNKIIAPLIGAGSKDENNRFTGILMGEVKSTSNTPTSEIGLFGYDKGLRTIFLDSTTGKAEFGKNTSGKIIIDPRSRVRLSESSTSKPTALLYSGNYTLPTPTEISGNTVYTMNVATYLPGNGMIIDLSTPQIGFGNGNFYVNNEGRLHAVNADVTGKITATSGSFTGTITAQAGGSIGGFTINDTDLSSRNGRIVLKGATNDTDPILRVSNSAGNITFEVNGKGDLTAINANIKGQIVADYGRIGNWSIEALQSNKVLFNPNKTLGLGALTASSSTMNNNFGVSGSKLLHIWGLKTAEDYTSINFGVGNDGTLYAKGAHIKSSTIDTASIPVLNSDKIAANAITAKQIATDAITSDKIKAGAVTAEELAAKAVVAGKIAAEAIEANNIKANAITAGKIAANAVTSDKIKAGAIIAGKIATDAVTSDKIKAGAITAGKIATNAVTANKIQAGAITTAKLDAGAVTANKIATGAVTAKKIAAGAITADKIAAGAITASKLAAGSISVSKLNGTDPAWRSLTFVTKIEKYGTGIKYYYASYAFLTRAGAITTGSIPLEHL